MRLSVDSSLGRVVVCLVLFLCATILYVTSRTKSESCARVQTWDQASLAADLSSESLSGVKRALLVATREYQDPSVATVAYAVNDATLLKERLILGAFPKRTSRFWRRTKRRRSNRPGRISRRSFTICLLA